MQTLPARVWVVLWPGESREMSVHDARSDDDGTAISAPPGARGRIYVPEAAMVSERASRRQAEERLALAVEALNQIASWGEGSKVTGGFDEPCSATTARKALAEVGGGDK